MLSLQPHDRSDVPANGAMPWACPGGNLGGKMQPSGASQGQAQPAGASVCAGQALYEALRDRLVVHGKEKVYGSIP